MDNGYGSSNNINMNGSPDPGAGKGFKPTVRNVVRILCSVCAIIFFCPTFMVSCSGQQIGVSAANVFSGIKAYGSEVAKPHPLIAIALLLPVAVIVLTFAGQRMSDKGKSVAMLCVSAFSMILWAFFRSAVKSAADQNYCEFKSTLWYPLNMLALLLLLIISLLLLSDKLNWETDIVEFFKGGGARNLTSGVMSSASNLMRDNPFSSNNGQSGMNGPNGMNGANGMNNGPAGMNGPNGMNGGSAPQPPVQDNGGFTGSFCPKCGNQVKPGSRFCNKCGNPLN